MGAGGKRSLRAPVGGDGFDAAARLAAVGSAEREQWCLDNWDAVAAEIGAAQNISCGVASHQLLVAQALSERLPRVADVFASGAVPFRLIDAIVSRSRNVVDAQVLAKLDVELAGQMLSWAGLSVAKTQAAIDYWVDRYDPYALRQAATLARGRHVMVGPASDGAGLAGIEGLLYAHDAAALDRRLSAMAHSVCAADRRTVDQRRADAMGALAAGADRLACGCDQPGCAGAREGLRTDVVVHVIAEQPSLADEGPVCLDGAQAQGPSSAELRTMTLREALDALPEPPSGPARTNPAAIIGAGIMPGPLLAATLAGTASIRALVHPGAALPEPRYRPSRGLADFVRCRDMTCRFPGCEQPADRCDLDHTIGYPLGPTCASNLKCLCRKHHLLKTFWGGPTGWRDRQLPDGTVIWTAPGGQTYTTHPGSRILFPALCRPTAAVTCSTAATAEPSRNLAMPRRAATRTQNRYHAIESERRLNNAHAAERNKPPPF